MKTTLLRKCFLLVLFSCCSCWAATSTYSDRELFVSATATVQGTHQEITFDPYRWGPYIGELGPMLTVSNVTFTGRYLLASSYSGHTTSGTVLFNIDAGGPLKIDFDYPVRAFGADYGSDTAALFSEFTATLTLDSGQAFSFQSPTNPDSTFFGFILDQPIRSMTFSDGGKAPGGLGFFFHEEMIKDIYMVMEVPEPGVAALFGLALLAVGSRAIYRRRRRQR